MLHALKALIPRAAGWSLVFGFALFHAVAAQGVARFALVPRASENTAKGCQASCSIGNPVSFINFDHNAG